MIKPVWMLRKEIGGEFLHRPLQLRTLVTRKLAKLLDVTCSPDQLQEAVRDLPAPLRLDIFKRIMANNDKVRSRVADWRSKKMCSTPGWRSSLEMISSWRSFWAITGAASSSSIW